MRRSWQGSNPRRPAPEEQYTRLNLSATAGIHIEMKVIFGIIVASNERLKLFNVRELSKGTIDSEINIIEALQLLDN